MGGELDQTVFRRLFDKTGTGHQIFRIEDRDDPGALRIVAQNEAASVLTGVDMTQLVGRTLREEMPQFLESEFPARYLKAGVTGVADEWEVTYSDERFPTAVWRSRVIPLDADHVAVVFDNITERRTAEAELKARTQQLEDANAKLAARADRVSANLDETEVRFRQVLEQVPAILWTMDSDLVVQSSSGMGLQQIGLKPDQLVGLSLQQYLGTHDPQDPAVAAHRQALTGTPANYTYELEGRILDVRLRPLLRADGGIDGVIGACLDVTEQRKLEELLKRKQRLEGIGRLAGGIAHDFNNLLMVALNYAHLASRSASDEVKGHLSQIVAASEHGARLTSQLLAFARQQVSRPEPMEIGGVIERTGTMLERILGDDVHVVLDTDSGAGVVQADRGQIEQVLMNLALNARDAMPSGGTLRVSTDCVDLVGGNAFDVPAGRYARLTVADDGVGMTADVIARAFEPFFTTKQEQGGTGLGLATVYGIVEQHGGSIRIESAPGSGTRFEIVMPHTSAAAPVAAVQTQSVPRIQGQTILVVDDDERVCSVTASVLRQAGYEVLESNRGSAALEVASSRGDISLALLDVMMPEMTGPQLGAKLKEIMPDISVVYMSGFPGDRLEDLPDAPYLAKPFSPTTLLDTIDRVSRSRA